MKVALVHDFLFKLGGAERVLKVLADLYPDAPIYTLLYDEKACGEVFPKDRVRASTLNDSWFAQRPRFLTHRMPQAIEEFDLGGFDLVISSSNAFAHGVITPPGTRHLCYCHSPMRYAWDWTHEYLDEQELGLVKRFLAKRLVHGLRLWDRVAADRPDKYLANSGHVKERLRKYYRVDAEVVYPPVDVERFQVSTGHDGYFLIVSALSPFKKVDLAVRTFSTLGLPLKIVGEGSRSSELKRMAGPTVEFLGRLSDREVAELMQRCRAFVFPGEEDFGIAPVEAMACGRPVIAYGRGGVTETVVEGATGVFFHEPTPESFDLGLKRFFEIEKGFDSGTIRKRAEEFSRARFEKEIREVIHTFMASDHA